MEVFAWSGRVVREITAGVIFACYLHQASQDRQAGPPINVVMLSDYSELHYRAEAQGESAVF